MCIDISMSIIEKVFKYEENEMSVIKSKGEIWFRGKDIAKASDYSIPHKAIREHIDPEDKSSLERLSKGGLKWTPLKIEQKSAAFINEEGVGFGDHRVRSCVSELCVVEQYGRP